MFTARALQTKTTETANPLDLFLAESPRPQKFSKSICFYRLIGVDGSDHAYIQRLNHIDQVLTAEQPGIPYMRLHTLKPFTQEVDLSLYLHIYAGWQAIPQDQTLARFAYSFPFTFLNETLEWTLKQGFMQTMEVYRTETPQSTPSMVRNYAVKLLYWLDYYLPLLYTPEAQLLKCFPKILYVGKIKKQESLFLYFLSLLGCDILYFNPEGDFTDPYPTVQHFSRLHILGPNREMPSLISPMPLPPTIIVPAESHPAVRETDTLRNQAANPPFPTKQIPPAPASLSPSQPEVLPEPISPPISSGKELSYEQLANFSASVVMIKVLDPNGQCFKTGSGVVIHSEGYILTNFHVVSDSSHYSVLFENDPQDYPTNTLIKYHPDYDLALLRVPRSSAPISVLDQGNLVRGQKVVAIGSPLGLFNTVSDGIISGFRRDDYVSMIQVTAPVSRGSSGGALLDMQGRLIGLITSGFDDGQNLNLAVDYQTIRLFAQNFLEKA